MIENFASNLMNLRIKSNLSQKELAEKLDISTQTISNIEKGKSYPTFTNLEKIANYFNATPNQLLGTSKEIELENAVLQTDEYSKVLKDILQKSDEISSAIETYFYKPVKITYNPQYGEVYTYKLSNGKTLNTSAEYGVGEAIDFDNNIYVVEQVKELSMYEKIMNMYNAIKEIDKNKN
ncbi:helix-turn-helix domain-containing protein [Lactococcus petauri]|uniref:helix-turn-helix domain-containing protein n=1 Tax=Lactococcus petauri TaxID=1940789 RepID=UPI0018AA4B62|nr:helix-turn-helix transcriptional regulator [Lactococcus petauri]MDC0826788.1 helix-turn-helix transcriptional regulator [Lactococcus petauri]